MVKKLRYGLKTVSAFVFTVFLSASQAMPNATSTAKVEVIEQKRTAIKFARDLVDSWLPTFHFPHVFQPSNHLTFGEV